MAQTDRAKYEIEYRKKNVKQVMCKLNRNTDPDLIEWIESKENMQGYLKSLIRKDMEGHGHA